MENRVRLILEKEFFVWLPWPPSVNSIYRRRGGRGGMFITDQGVAWFKTACALLQAHPGYRLHKWGWWGRIGMSFTLVPPTARRYDIDNRDKVLCDALEKSGLIVDDAQLFIGDRVKFDKQPGGVYAGVYMGLELLEPTAGVVFPAELLEGVL